MIQIDESAIIYLLITIIVGIILLAAILWQIWKSVKGDYDDTD